MHTGNDWQTNLWFPWTNTLARWDLRKYLVFAYTLTDANVDLLRHDSIKHLFASTWHRMSYLLGLAANKNAEDLAEETDQ